MKKLLSILSIILFSQTPSYAIDVYEKRTPIKIEICLTNFTCKELFADIIPSYLTKQERISLNEFFLEAHLKKDVDILKNYYNFLMTLESVRNKEKDLIIETGNIL